MTPSHVLVKQCTGGCTPLQPSCLPSKTSVKRVPVLVAKCGINLGKSSNLRRVTKCGIILGKFGGQARQHALSF